MVSSGNPVKRALTNGTIQVGVIERPLKMGNMAYCDALCKMGPFKRANRREIPVSLRDLPCRSQMTIRGE